MIVAIRRQHAFSGERTRLACWFRRHAETNFAGGTGPRCPEVKVRDDGGVIASTRWRVRSPGRRSRSLAFNS